MRVVFVTYEGGKDIEIDHVSAGIVQAGTFHRLLGISEDWESMSIPGGVTEHFLELDLPGMHEHNVRDPCRAEFMALA